ncbi:hypothetical protein C7444_11561 [Sphaerotilus hippei]|uniref:Uncharacterized protein n=1 Tax=Sphaerotilus hippei TaxID=744406 RepID=A0A318GXC8_9BURK|nr:hypothetical protein [Sphaerotilus hippei]PXW94167.1 hypothetical protein C7444_11561 [Sphaerotilus hippei]
MATNPMVLRRRAACLVLSPLLDEEALLAALWLQHETMRGDAVSDIIGYIDDVAGRNLLDAVSRKRLYESYYKALKLPEQDLPMDPWPAMQASRTVAAPPVVPAPPAAPPAPVSAPPAPVAATESPEPSRARAPDPTDAPDEVVVFSALWRALLDEVQQDRPRDFSDLRRAALEALERARLRRDLRDALLDAWRQPMNHGWLIPGDEAELSEAVNLLYVALCETLGPVEADQMLTRAVRVAGQHPQARRFPPRRLI